jgi:adenylate cyclase
VLGAVLAVLFARAVGTPIAEIAGSARAVGRGEFSISVPVRSNDEIGALAGSFNRMVAGLREREYIRETFGRVVAPEVRDHILESGGGLRGSRATATVLFFDIQGYTGALEGMDAEAAVSWLNRVFAVCSHHVSGHGGTIDKFIGDAVLAVFGVPRPTPDAAARAVAAARAIRDGLAELSGRLGGEGLPPVGFGIGVHSGTVVAGTIGSPERMEYTVIGDTVNVAARIEGMTRTLDRTILLSEATVRAANAANDGRIEPMGTHQLRGRRESIALFAG